MHQSGRRLIDLNTVTRDFLECHRLREARSGKTHNGNKTRKRFDRSSVSRLWAQARTFHPTYRWIDEMRALRETPPITLAGFPNRDEAWQSSVQQANSVVRQTTHQNALGSGMLDRIRGSTVTNAAPPASMVTQSRLRTLRAPWAIRLRSSTTRWPAARGSS
jgi:hypothetical protein